MKKRYIIIVLILILIASFVYIYSFVNRKLPLYKILSRTNIANIYGWKLIQFNNLKYEKSYYFIKNIKDTSFHFSFIYYKKDGKIQSLSGYDLIKEFPYKNSIYTLSITLEGDTLYFCKRDANEQFFNSEHGSFIKGKYYYYYTLEKRQLDSCQIKYFKENRDSLIKAGANNIPEFTSDCKILVKHDGSLK